MLNPQRDIRCTCGKHPLLGIYGRDEGGLYIHVKVFKAGKIYTELWVRGDGAHAEIRCRSCMRIFRITIRENQPVSVIRLFPDINHPAVPVVADHG